ncbi:MAG: electron transfer flavoprotein subunit beta/FixA family protein [Chloroflexota bacterium]|nr:electron transfer flavoprotein subunit beta/FixA family protein [Chloroflexota bacterium]
MNIVIPMKRVPDTETKVGVTDGQIDTSSLKSWVINPYDEYAIEEALRLIEAEGQGKITIVTIGPEEAQETIRKALAMGADEAYHLQDEAFEDLDPLGRARVLAAAIQKIGHYDFIWAGMKGVDDDLGQTAILLAEFLDLPQVTNVITVEEVGGGHLVVSAEAEGGYKRVKIETPCVLTETQGPNEPRYPSLRGIMGAKKKPMTVWSADDLDIDVDELEPLLERVRVKRPPARAAGRIIEGEPTEAARELVRLLHEEAKVL